MVLAGVVEPGQHPAHRLHPGPLLVVALHHGPRRVGGVGVEEHRLLRLGVVVPAFQRGEVDRRELPPAYRVELPDREPGALLGCGHREPELDQLQPGADQHPLQVRGLPQELQVLAGRCRTPSRAPRRPGCTRTGRTAPARRPPAGARCTAGSTTALLALVGLSSATTLVPRGLRCWVNRLIVPPLPAASRPSKMITTRWPVPLDPVLQLQQLDLLLPLDPVVFRPGHPLRVREVLAPRLQPVAVHADQLRLAVEVVLHPVIAEGLQQVAHCRLGPVRLHLRINSTRPYAAPAAHNAKHSHAPAVRTPADCCAPGCAASNRTPTANSAGQHHARRTGRRTVRRPAQSS